MSSSRRLMGLSSAGPGRIGLLPQLAVLAVLLLAGCQDARISPNGVPYDPDHVSFVFTVPGNPHHIVIQYAATGITRCDAGPGAQTRPFERLENGVEIEEVVSHQLVLHSVAGQEVRIVNQTAWLQARPLASWPQRITIDERGTITVE